MILPRENAAFAWRMEEMLDLYEEPYDEKRPVVCFDERPCQLLADVRQTPPPRPGGPGGGARLVDHEYERGGTANAHVSFEPLTGWRRVEITQRGRKQEFAEQVRRLAEEDYPQAGKIRLVLDNLSTHAASAFYEAFDPERARCLARRVEFVYTPVHGSWLNMAEISISALVRQCLGKRRLADEGTLRREAKAWAARRNRLGSSVEWRFTTEEARIELRSLYPATKE
ncbi:MAG: IS630 family transposase [Rubrobacteraceae bacterium]